jgi:hypothetical protein
VVTASALAITSRDGDTHAPWHHGAGVRRTGADQLSRCLRETPRARPAGTPLAEISTRTKQEALRAVEPPGTSAGSRAEPIWLSDESFLNWLAFL